MNEIRFDCVYSDGIITLRRKNHLPTDYYFEYFAGLWSLFIKYILIASAHLT